jgi:hypothetical protein
MLSLQRFRRLDIWWCGAEDSPVPFLLWNARAAQEG